MAATLINNGSHLKETTGGKCHLEMDPVKRQTCEAAHRKEELETKTTAYIQTQLEPNSGSSVSIESRSFAEHSDVQPLTDVHLCRYEDCVKFHKKMNSKNPDEGPHSPLKHLFLYLVISLLVVWIIVYTVLSQLNVI